MTAPKKTAVKKPPAKKAAAPKTALAKKPVVKGGFNLLEHGESIVQHVSETATAKLHLRKNRHGSYISISQVRREMTPAPSFAWQYLLGSYGLRHKTCLELIGAESVGKTTLMMQLIAQGMLYDQAPALYMSADAKPMSHYQISRIMHRDPVIGERMMKMITFMQPHSLPEMAENVDIWVNSWRETLPIHIPLNVVIEHMGGLLSPSESLGYYDYAQNMSEANKKKYKGVSEGSNFGHAKFASDYRKRMPLIMERQNVNFFLSSWQNQDVDMSGMASNFPEMWKKLRNKTKNCGEAINQLSAYQFIIAKVGTAVDAAKNPTGSRIAVRCEKNSYGAPDREITYELRTNYAMDTDTYSEPVFHYGEWFAKFMADRKLLGTQSDSKLFSCKAYGLIGLTAPDFERQFMMIPDAVAYLGKQLRIDGFDPTVDEIRAAIGEVTGEEPPAPPAPTTLVPPPPPTAEEMAVINAKSAASGAEETESNNEDTTAGERVSPE